MTTVERIAKAFHDVYEEQADFYGWKPQGSTRVQWDDLPTANKALMLSVVDTLLHDGVIATPGGGPRCPVCGNPWPLGAEHECPPIEPRPMLGILHALGATGDDPPIC